MGVKRRQQRSISPACTTATDGVTLKGGEQDNERRAVRSPVLVTRKLWVLLPLAGVPLNTTSSGKSSLALVPASNPPSPTHVSIQALLPAGSTMGILYPVRCLQHSADSVLPAAVISNLSR